MSQSALGRRAQPRSLGSTCLSATLIPCANILMAHAESEPIFQPCGSQPSSSKKKTGIYSQGVRSSKIPRLEIQFCGVALLF